MTIFICGGGTGGHFFSGVAVAERFLKMNPDARVVFVGTRYGIEARTHLPDSRMSIQFVWSRGVKGRGLLAKAQAISMMVVGFVQSFLLLCRVRPKVVLGVGGYASVPTVFMALVLKSLLGFRVIVLEQNSYAGMANRVFAKLGARALAAFPCENFQLVDLPLRSAYEERALNVRSVNWPPKVILVMGGSQGASGLNTQWTRILVDLKTWNPGVLILHQTGLKDVEPMTRIYKDMRISAEVFSFSNDMPSFYDRADLLICRAGAMTVFEAMLFKRPAVFVPFPNATDDHQRKNALSVQDARWIVDERDFDWARLLPLLQTDAPKIPVRSSVGQVLWTDLLSFANKV